MEIFSINQEINVVPKDFKKAVRGKITEVREHSFDLILKNEPDGLLINHLTEFYSHTPNGVLYFQSDISVIDKKTLTIVNPIKHRFLQRRKFARVGFFQQIELKSNKKSFKADVVDISAGGMQLKIQDKIDIDGFYDFSLNLSSQHVLKGLFQPVRIGRDSEAFYTVSGRFKDLTNIDKMTLVQFCMKKQLELVNI